MKFKYSEYTGPNNIKIFRPTISIVFKNRSKFIQTEAIVDSGSDFTIIPIEIAGILDIKLDVHKKTTFHGAGGNPFTVYPSPEAIEHIIRQGGFRPIKWKAKIYFAESQPSILLGHKGFLEKFKTTLDGRNKELEIS